MSSRKGLEAGVTVMLWESIPHKQYPGPRGRNIAPYYRSLIEPFKDPFKGTL